MIFDQPEEPNAVKNHTSWSVRGALGNRRSYRERGILMKKILLSFITNTYLHFFASILGIFGFFGIRSDNFLDTFGAYTWIIDATKWSLIFGAFIFAFHAYLRAENNRKRLINVKISAYDEAYKHFTNQLSYAIGRYNGYSSNSAPEKEKYSKIGVIERINEVKSARLQLLSVCGEYVRDTLTKAGTGWLDDINLFGQIAPTIMEELSKIAHKDRG